MSAHRWCWFAVLGTAPSGGMVGAPAGALASARARRLDGEEVGLLVAWPPGERPVETAARIDGRAIDPAGPRMAVSWADAGARHVLYDDPAVVAAMQAVLAQPWPAFVSTLAADASHLAGALTGAPPELVEAWPGWWSTDAFAGVLPAQRMLVEAGLFTSVPRPAGPVHQRYGGAPWPRDGFEA